MRCLFLLAFFFNRVAHTQHACPCYFAMWLTPNGLGNRVAETIAGWQIADELGCEYLFDRDGFARNSIHGGYDGVADFLGIGRGQRTWHDVRNQIAHEVEVREWPGAPVQIQCNTLYKAVHTKICRFKNRYTTWCTYSTSWERHKWRLRENFAIANRWLRLSFRRSRALSVAWHLRSGDIAPDRDNGAFFDRVSASIRNAAVSQNTRTEFHFVFQNSAPEFPEEYAFLQHGICKRSRCFLHWNESVTESLRTLMSAEVLVTSRSSFSYVAALYTKAIVLFETPKEECGSCYWTADYNRVDKTGRIFEPEEFQARLSALLRQRRQKRATLYDK